MSPAAEHRQAVIVGQRRLARTDPLLRRLIRRYGDCGLSPNWRHTPWEALVRAVIYQQLAGAAARTIHGRFVALFNGMRFPTPEALLAASDQALRAAGLSRQKSSYLRDIAGRAVAGTIPRTRAPLKNLSDEAVIELLTQARGVGRWTAEMLLMSMLGRLDVLPVDDYGVRSGYAKSAGLAAITPRELATLGARWAPHRSVATWYLWRAADD